MTKPIPELTASDIARFWAKVDVRGPDECWPWIAYTDKYGYGTFGINGTIFLVHRISMALDGRDPIGLCALHTCDNPPCCNPSHLFAGSDADNVADKVHKGRQAKGRANAAAKLTANEVASIKIDGRLQRIIAAEYGVGQSTISNIKRGVYWAHS